MPVKFQDRQIYGGTIVDQSFFKTKGGKYLFKFVVSLECEMENAYKGVRRPFPDGSTYEKEVVINFADATPDMLTWRMADLQRLGFTGTDIAQLQPGSEGHQSFVGRRVMVACKLIPKGEYTNEYWNLWFPKKAANEKLGADTPVTADDVRRVLGKHAQAALTRSTAREAANAAPPMAMAATGTVGAKEEIPF